MENLKSFCFGDMVLVESGNVSRTFVGSISDLITFVSYLYEPCEFEEFDAALVEMMDFGVTFGDATFSHYYKGQQSEFRDWWTGDTLIASFDVYYMNVGLKITMSEWCEWECEGYTISSSLDLFNLFLIKFSNN